jgi:hypothetical protein
MLSNDLRDSYRFWNPLATCASNCEDLVSFFAAQPCGSKGHESPCYFDPKAFDLRPRPALLVLMANHLSMRKGCLLDDREDWKIDFARKIRNLNSNSW